MAYDFSGTNQILTNENGVNGIDVNAFTVGLLWNHDTNTADGVSQVFLQCAQAVASTASSVALTLLGTAGDSKLRFVYVVLGAPGVWISTPTYAPGTWRSAIATYDASSDANDPVIYANGAAVAITETSTRSGTPHGGQDSIVIGESTGGSGDYDGKMAELFFYNRILGADEIESIGKNFLSPQFFPRGLVQYWPLIRNRNSRVSPSAGLTASGATVSDHPRVIYPAYYGPARKAAAAGGPETFGFYRRRVG